MQSIELELLFTIQGQLGEALDLGNTPEGNRIIFPVIGGSFKGPKIEGEIVPGTCADWGRMRSDGSLSIDVRLSLRTVEGDLIFMSYLGRAGADHPEGLAAAFDFAKPDPSENSDTYYFRILPLFETSSDKYAWLNKIVAVGSGMTGAGGVTYTVYTVK